MPVMHCCRGQKLLFQRKDNWQSGSDGWMFGSSD